VYGLPNVQIDSCMIKDNLLFGLGQRHIMIYKLDYEVNQQNYFLASTMLDVSKQSIIQPEKNPGKPSKVERVFRKHITVRGSLDKADKGST